MIVNENCYLRSKGINILTGESCNYKLRLLCDVTQEGKDHLRDFLGVADIAMGESMNGAPYVGRIMLTHVAVQELGIFIALGEFFAIYQHNDDGKWHSIDTEEKYNEYRAIARKLTYKTEFKLGSKTMHVQKVM